MLIDRVLSLDISSKTGWALILSSDTSFDLEACGAIEAIHEPPGQYPDNFVDWAYRIFSDLVDLIEIHRPDVLVIEETVAGSKGVFSQKILEYVHMLVARLIKHTGIRRRYFLTGEWRSIVGCLMTKEEKKRNKTVKDIKKETGVKVAKINGKVAGKITKKHVNIRRANEIFGKYFEKPLRKKDEDLCDALLLSVAWHLEKMKKLENKDLK